MPTAGIANSFGRMMTMPIDITIYAAGDGEDEALGTGRIEVFNRNYLVVGELSAPRLLARGREYQLENADNGYRYLYTCSEVDIPRTSATFRFP